MAAGWCRWSRRHDRLPLRERSGKACSQKSVPGSLHAHHDGDERDQQTDTGKQGD
jgi:hypothetical protein